jgi:hypothetical protein
MQALCGTFANASNLLAHHRSHCDGRQSTDGGATGRLHPDAGMSRHDDDRHGRRCEAQPVSMGIVVNFTARTVQGFGHPADTMMILRYILLFCLTRWRSFVILDVVRALCRYPTPFVFHRDRLRSQHCLSDFSLTKI